MSDALRIREIESFRQDAMDEAYDQMLFRDWCAADAQARRTKTISDMKFARTTYYRFMRARMTDTQRRVIELENEIAELKAEIATLSKGRRRPRIPVPVWRDPPVSDDGGTPP